MPRSRKPLPCRCRKRGNHFNDSNWHTYSGCFYWIGCPACSKTGPEMRTEAEAVAEWNRMNRRPKPKPRRKGGGA